MVDCALGDNDNEVIVAIIVWKIMFHDVLMMMLVDGDDDDGMVMVQMMIYNLEDDHLTAMIIVAIV